MTTRSTRTSLRRLAVLPLLGALLALIAAAPAALPPEDQEPHGILDGRMFRTELGKKNNAKGEVDEMTFQRGLFRSATGEEHGFLDAPYQADQRGHAIHFRVSGESIEEGTMEWQGTVLGDHIEGTVSWTEHHQLVEYWFRGAIKHPV